eukprot:gb/GECG01015421.1/.p1 GENE.gb/GECG01015421.1/~~gb/GECG01015421.1/.p1  ORF type:complete len:195 (+),score=40.12 gb/GECG01015421.1/:1-585(+)
MSHFGTRHPMMDDFEHMRRSMDRMMDSFFGGRFWDPFNTMADIDQPGNLLGDQAQAPSGAGESQAVQRREGGSEQLGFPNSRFPFLNSMALDVREKDKSYVLTADVPGVPKENVKVEVEGDTLTISADRKEEKEDKGEKYRRIERRSGSMKRSMKLPQNADKEKIKASCDNGVLTVDIAKLPEAKSESKKIDVK